MSRRRSGKVYRFEMSAKQHEELLDLIRRLPCEVAICGYWSPLYATALQECGISPSTWLRAAAAWRESSSG
jgi:hypothetical protein